MTLDDVFLRAGAAPWLLAAPLAAAALWRVEVRRRRRAAETFGPRAAALAPGAPRGRGLLGPAAFGAAALCAVLAAMQPVGGETRRGVAPRGADVVVCLDVSRSMLARDAAPTRLDAAKRALRDLASRADGDRLALVVFAGEARLLVPLTRDLRSFADLADAADPLAVERGGTDLGAALDTALAALARGTGEHEAVVLVTDGEDLGGRGAAAAETLRGRGVPVHCVAYGTAGGAKIPVPAAGGEAFLRDRTGRDVVSAADVPSLRRIADRTGGAFVEASSSASPLATLHEAHVRPLAARSFEERERRERSQRFQVPLLAAFALWILDLCRRGR